MIPLLAEADVAAVPAVGDDRAQRVLAGPDLAGHVEAAVIDPLVIVGPAGVELVVADASAVQVDVEDPSAVAYKRGAAARACRRGNRCGDTKAAAGPGWRT